MQSIYYIHARASESESYILLRSATAFVTSALFFASFLYVIVRKYFEYHVRKSLDVRLVNVDIR